MFQVVGSLHELDFERALIANGYKIILSPCRNDVGVDYVVFTSKGWVGIQVKTATPRTKHNRHTTGGWIIDLKAKSSGGKRKWQHVGSCSRYRSVGVDVFAAWTPRGFFLAPLEEIDAETHILMQPQWWEAWTVVLGYPPQVDAQQGNTAIEISQLEMMWARS